jgi:hypothetical protein
LDVKATVLHYDDVFGGGCPTTTQCRFYYEPHFARYEERDLHDKKGNPSAGTTFVWTDEGLFLIDHQQKNCTFWSSQTCQQIRQVRTQMPERTFWDRFWKGYSLLLTGPAYCSEPDDVLPLFLSKDTKKQQQRFDFKVTQHDKQIFLRAMPKQKNERFQEIDLLLDAISYQLLAHRSVLKSGDSTVHVFDHVKVNTPPSDRAELIKAVPQGYRLERADDMLFGRKDARQEHTR